jgi:hypothetical protein
MVEVQEAEFLADVGAFLLTFTNGASLVITGTGLYRLGSADGKQWAELLAELPLPAAATLEA